MLSISNPLLVFSGEIAEKGRTKSVHVNKFKEAENTDFVSHFTCILTQKPNDSRKTVSHCGKLKG